MKEIIKVLEEIKEHQMQTVQLARSTKVYQLADKALTQALILYSVSESILTIPDIRNKLSPITHLISMVELGEKDFVNKAIPQAKESVNYLAQRKVYPR